METAQWKCLVAEQAQKQLNYHGVLSAGVVLAYEYLITFDEEVELIWPKPNDSLIKWLFLFNRYVALAWQICIQIMYKWILSRVSARSQYCRYLFASQTIGSQCLMTSVEMILALRVHALYRKRTITVLLSVLLFAELLMGISGIVVLSPKLDFSPTCFARIPPIRMVPYGVVVLTTQTFLFLLTFIKHFSGVQSHWSRIPILSLISRDGAFAFVVIFASEAAQMTALSRENGPAFLQFWVITTASCVGCRLIINLQRLGNPECQESITQIELTTQLSEPCRASVC